MPRTGIMVAIAIGTVLLGLVVAARALLHTSASKRTRMSAAVFGTSLCFLGMGFGWTALSLPAHMARQACRERIRLVAFAFNMYKTQYRCEPRSLLYLSAAHLIVEADLLSPLAMPRHNVHVDYAFLSEIKAPLPSSVPIIIEMGDTHADGSRCVVFQSGDMRTLLPREFEVVMATAVADICGETSAKLTYVVPRLDVRLGAMRGVRIVEDWQRVGTDIKAGLADP